MAEDRWITYAGRTMLRVMGGSPEGDPPADPPSDPPADPPPADPPSGDDDLLKGAQNPDAVRNALKAERDRAAKAEKAARDAQAKVDEYESANKSEKEKLEERATKAERDAADAGQRALRYEVAAAKGVPLTQAHRLQGSTKQELERDADAFMKDLKGSNGTTFDGGARGSAAEPADLDAAIRHAAGRA